MDIENKINKDREKQEQTRDEVIFEKVFPFIAVLIVVKPLWAISSTCSGAYRLSHAKTSTYDLSTYVPQ